MVLYRKARDENKKRKRNTERTQVGLLIELLLYAVETCWKFWGGSDDSGFIYFAAS